MHYATATKTTRRQPSGNAIDSLQSHAARLARGNESVRPGMPFRITEAATANDIAWQGDLGIEVVEAVGGPGYEPAKPITQLVPGTSTGARHVLDDLQTVTDFQLPAGWNTTTYEGLQGPSFRCTQDTAIVHPTHGDITIAAGQNVTLRYQRNWENEQRRERRSLD